MLVHLNTWIRARELDANQLAELLRFLGADSYIHICYCKPCGATAHRWET